MVLLELGNRITSALRTMANSTIIDMSVVDDMLKEICNALVASDVNVKLVMQLRKNIRDSINLEEMASGINKRKMVQQAVFDELCKLLDSGNKPYQPVKGKPNVMMFVGLQGSGKTTTVSKLALHYKRKNWKSSLICADTFRAGAYAQLKQNAMKAKIPFFGSLTEADPVKIAAEGVQQMKAEGSEIIIVDTSGRHKQEAELFKEMEQVAAAVKPDCIIFVMDGSIGQAAFDQAKAFKDQVAIGAVIITKMDGHAKGGGALSAVAATQSPIIFLGTGEHMDELEPFVTRTFVSKLLGMGDMAGLIKKIKEVVPADQANAANPMLKENFTLRDMYEQFQTILKMGPLGKVMEMLPGMGQLLQQLPGAGADSTMKVKVYMTIMDSMTDDELDDMKIWTVKATRDSRVYRIARGSGRSVREVSELLEQFKQFEKIMKKAKGMLRGTKGGNMMPRNMSQLTNMLPPNVMKQFGGFAGMQNLMKQMGGMNLGGLGGFGGSE